MIGSMKNLIELLTPRERRKGHVPSQFIGASLIAQRGKMRKSVLTHHREAARPRKYDANGRSLW